MTCSKILTTVLVFIGGLFLATTSIALPSKSPVGYWKTIDDVTGKPKSIVHIWEDKQHLLMGQIIKIYPGPGQSAKDVCSKCKGDRRNQPIVGMVILSGLKGSQLQWNKGEILDPENGKTYSCSAKLAENGSSLNVRGYIGLPLLGRSQTWQRVDLMSANRG